MAETQPTVQCIIQLPRGVRDRLVAEGGSVRLSKIIRERLQAGFDLDALDPGTARLVEAVKELAKTLGPNGTWHRDAFTFAVFKAALVGPY